MVADSGQGGGAGDRERIERAQPPGPTQKAWWFSLTAPLNWSWRWGLERAWRGAGSILGRLPVLLGFLVTSGTADPPCPQQIPNIFLSSHTSVPAHTIRFSRSTPAANPTKPISTTAIHPAFATLQPSPFLCLLVLNNIHSKCPNNNQTSPRPWSRFK